MPWVLNRAVGRCGARRPCRARQSGVDHVRARARAAGDLSGPALLCLAGLVREPGAGADLELPRGALLRQPAHPGGPGYGARAPRPAERSGRGAAVAQAAVDARAGSSRRRSPPCCSRSSPSRSRSPGSRASVSSIRTAGRRSRRRDPRARGFEPRRRPGDRGGHARRLMRCGRRTCTGGQPGARDRPARSAAPSSRRALTGWRIACPSARASGHLRWVAVALPLAPALPRRDG